MQFGFMAGCGTTNVILIQKGLVLHICRFEKSFLLSPWGYCIVGFRETRFKRVVSWVYTANVWRMFKVELE